MNLKKTLPRSAMRSRWLCVMAMRHVGRSLASLYRALPNRSLCVWVVRAIAPLRQGIANDRFVLRDYPLLRVLRLD